MSIINSINFTAERLSMLGLTSVNLKSLGQITVIAGRNGAGKSRILDAIKSDANNLEDAKKNVMAWTSQPVFDENSLQLFYKNVVPNNTNRPDVQKTQKAFLEVERTYNLEKEFELNVVDFFPKSNSLHSPGKFTLDQAKEHADSAVNSRDPEKSQDYALPYIQEAQDNYYEATNTSVRMDEQKKTSAIGHYESLVAIIQTILQTKIGRDDRKATLFSRSIAELKLSTGQVILLKLAVRLHAQGLNLKNTVAIIDEPENHLHPDAVREVIDKLMKISESLQIIVATHSIPLLAHINSIDSRALWYIADGIVAPGTKKTISVLQSLLGDEKQIENLASFIDLPAKLAATNYAAQSLFPPGVHGGGHNDPQTSQISQIITNSLPECPTLVDFGAGKGRLLNGIADASNFDGNVAGSINYIAYDAYEGDRISCEKTISDYYGSAAGRWFCKRRDIIEHYGENFADIVVLCNVLHEIDPIDWLSILGKNGDIYNMLKPTGCLLIVEDQLIPIGEKAHRNGFLVLDTLPLHKLFDVNNEEKKTSFAKNDARGDGRLTAHLISRKLMEKVSLQSIAKAIKEQNNIAVENLAAVRKESPSYAAGMKSAFYLQTIGNISLILKEKIFLEQIK